MPLLSTFQLARALEGADPKSSLIHIFEKQAAGPLLIYTQKSVDTVALVYAAFQQNIPYIPIDPQAPFERAFKVFTETKPVYVFIDGKTELYKHIQQHFSSNVLWQNNDDLLLQITQQNNFNHPTNLAAVLFTSGSTGLPKGIMLSRPNIMAFVDWMVAEYKIDSTSRILAVSPLHFDLSLFEMFGVFTTGATLVFPESTGVVNPLMLARCIHDQKTDTIYATPSWYQLLLSFGKVNRYDFGFVKNVLIAGEPLRENLVHQLQKLFPQARLANLYGPTETNVCTWYNIPREGKIQTRNGIVAIGQACPYAQVSINPQNILQVQGQTVMLGYWPRLLNETTYNTGDVVEYDNQEKLYHNVGRSDRMIKRHGYRIEPAEIEATLAALPQVLQVAVTAIQQGAQTRIVAHIVAQPFDTETLRAHCLRFLPPYMLPDVFEQHQNLPLTASGKTDYRKLATNGNTA